MLQPARPASSKHTRIDLDVPGALDKTIWLLLGKEEPLTQSHTSFDGQEAFRRGGPLATIVRTINVMSSHSGGHIRGFFLIDGKIFKWRPDYAVRAALGLV